MSYQETLRSMASDDERIVVMTAENRAAIRALPSQLGSRFIDVGICEQTLVGAAAGLALRGRIPVVHALAAFLTMRAFEFARTDAGLPNLPVKLVGGVPGFLSDANGATHQAIEDVSLMRGIPNMQVFCPADESELIAALPTVITEPAPCYIRYTDLKPAVEHRPFSIGKAERLSEGSDVAIFVYGILLRQALEAKALLEARGRSVRLVNVRMPKPFDSDELFDAVRSTRLLVTLEDHFLVGGLYSIVAELLVRKGVSAKVLPLALDDRFFRPGLLPDVLEYEGFTGPAIATKIQAALG